MVPLALHLNALFPDASTQKSGPSCLTPQHPLVSTLSQILKKATGPLPSNSQECQDVVNYFLRFFLLDSSHFLFQLKLFSLYPVPNLLVADYRYKYPDPL